MAGGADHVSSFPDKLLQYLLSFLQSREARWHHCVHVIRINNVDNFSSVQQLNKFVIHLLLQREWTPLYVYELDSFHNGTNMPYHAMFMCLGSTTPIRLTILDCLR
uniref:Uncharacterized protein n=1 Tax=Oryza barthii TaxID=65489 RepID=A0A0D3HKA9_9ORYZ